MRVRKKCLLRRITAVLTLILPAFNLFAQETTPGAVAPAINSGDTAWILTSAVLVLLMTVPALALFYGGMVRRKNILSTIYYSLAAAIIVSLLWVIGQYSLIFSTSAANPADATGIAAWIGDLKHAFMNGITVNSIHPNAPTIPEFVFSMYQLMFAIITVALISGAVVERMSFGGWFIFTLLWSIIVYTPLAHWVWNPNGWLFKMGALDFAGGLVVHTSSGISALIAVLILGPRIGFRKTPINPPANVGYIFIGATLLWVGWFGFNAGSALAGNGLAGNAFLVTNTAGAAAAVTWMLLEWIVLKKPSVVGASTGVVAGLVAITPASGFVDVPAALLIGISISIISFTYMSVFRKKFKYDDALDVFSVHGIGGIWGAIVTGIFANPAVNPLGKGAIAGNIGQIGIQCISILAAAVIGIAGTLISLFLANLLTGGRIRVNEMEETEGLDLSQHGEQLEQN